MIGAPERVSRPLQLDASDDANRQLLANVRPASWVNPTPKPRYTLVVVGAGTAGLVAAAGAAGLGATVAIVERALMGGDCLNVGCVPSKTMIRAARAWHAASTARAEFGGPDSTGGEDFSAVMTRVRRLRAQLAPIDGAPRFSQLGVDVLFGNARFVSPTALDVDGTRLSFRRALIASGARAAVPPIPGLADTAFLTNESVFNLTSRPETLTVLGAGPVACELAQAFARFGTKVTVVARENRILLNDDADAAAIVQAAMERDGVRFRLDVDITKVERSGTGHVAMTRREGCDEAVGGDALLVALGRAPNVEGLGLDVAGVDWGAAGVRVDDYLRTTNPRVFAAGDVCSIHRFTHVADAQARIVVQNALFASRLHIGYKRASALVVPWCTYTSPELAHVGLTATQARDAGISLDTIDVQMREVDRAILDGEGDGFLRVHLKRGTDRILGATLVAERAGDLVSEITLAMTQGVGFGAMSRTIYPYPTQAEVIRKAANAWQRARLTPRVKKLFTRYFQLLG
jgi:pyruvate/2-oxoglutarate dehydrogenase complex dihydrolipoamide dehydrogenase (E3) component